MSAVIDETTALLFISAAVVAECSVRFWVAGSELPYRRWAVAGYQAAEALRSVPVLPGVVEIATVAAARLYPHWAAADCQAAAR
jgi:hypothetical protein